MFRVEGRCIGEGCNTFITAEIGVNHNGSFDTGKRLIKRAKEAGADAVKFQTWKTDSIALRDTSLVDYQKRSVIAEESQYEMLQRLELPYEWHAPLKQYAEQLGLSFFSTMEDKESVDFLLSDIEIPMIKVGSGDLTNYPLLKHTARYQVPMILSSGMASLSEIDTAIRVIQHEGNSKLVLCQCTSQYPCPYEDINLRAIVSLKQSFGVIPGFSDHSEGIGCAVASVALGAKYIEKHLTLSKQLPGPDHKSSVEPQEFAAMASEVRNVERALGDGIKRVMPSEIENKQLIRRKIVITRAMNQGDTIDEDTVTLKRANYGLDARYCELVIGMKLKKAVQKNDILTTEHIGGD